LDGVALQPSRAQMGQPEERRAPGQPPMAWSTRAEPLSQFYLLVADIAAFAFTFALVHVALTLLPIGDIPPPRWAMWYTLAAWLLFRGGSGFYSPAGKFPPIELKRSFETVVAAFIIHLALLITSGEAQPVYYARLVVWPMILPFSYIFRAFARGWLLKRGLYGVPIVVIGNGIAAHRAIREMRAHPKMGMVPVALFSSEVTRPGEEGGILGVPLVGRMERAIDYSFPYPVRHALLAVGAGWADERNHAMSRALAKRYTNLQIFTNVLTNAHLLAQTRPLGPYLSIETQHIRFSRSQRMLKRALDLAIAVPGLIAASPAILAAGIAIKLADRGPAFFSQTREGEGGKPVKIYKMRSMVQGAEAKLSSYLAANPDALFEYEQTMKLRKDPRIIPGIGHFIRRSSIDELPQLWNVIRGDLSLVGPRVMPTREIELYSAEGRDLRRDMVPGLTGFWQVEHRNDSDFGVREVADSFYIANWSVWMDIWIILRTVKTLTSRSGAY
jgi:Undecaprenyl-phosphate galactose phosphotransferase WbaP